MTHLLPLLKFIVPVVGLTVVGSGVYFIGGIVPKKDLGKPLPGVYLLVKGTTAQDSGHTDPLTKKVSDKTVKDYFCQLTLDGNKTLEDKACSLFNLNKTSIVKEPAQSSQTDSSAQQQAVSHEHVDLYENMFKSFNLTTTSGSVSTTSHHILKVSQDFYDALTLQKNETNKAIKLVDSTDANKHFGSVKEVVKLNLKTVTDIKDPRVSLFLARVKEPAASLSGTATGPLSCQLDKKTSVKCNIFTLDTASAKTNHLTKTKLSNLTALSSLSGSTFTKDNYVVVQLLNDQTRVSELKNKTITINQIKGTPSTADKLGEFIFDQLLIGQIASSPSSSTIFPIGSKKAAYLVKKTSTATNIFSGLTTGDNKNYKCKYTISDFVNYDNSCTLQTFPTTNTSRTYKALTTSTTQGFAEITSSDSNADQFLLTFDSNKLFNLKTVWDPKSKASVSVSIEKTTAASETATFDLLQELKPTKAIGLTDLLLVKYKTSEAISSITGNGKCSLTKNEADGVSCELRKATLSSSVPTSFDANATTSFNDGDYLAVKFTELKNIKEFEGNTLNYFETVSGTKKKITFDIIAAMGGDIASGKIFYFLEHFRDKSDIPSSTTVSKAS